MTTEEIRDKINALLMGVTELIPDAHIQVLATWNEGGLSKMINTGTGNWYARQGLAHEFINADIAQEHAVQLANELRNEGTK
jgi:hypothetical protein